MRSARGCDRAASANGREGSGSGESSPGIGPRNASRTMAVSITERVSAPKVIQWLPSRSCGARGTRPLWGLSPNRPVHAAGMRIEPAPSTPSAAGTMPAATAAAEPPLDPPGVRSTSHGLRVTPQVTDSVNGHRPSSGIVVLPTTTAPAARSRRTTSASLGGAGRERARSPAGHLAGEIDLVLDRDGHPQQRRVLARRPCAGRPGRRPRGRGSAYTAPNAFRSGSRASMRASANSTSSREDTSPRRRSSD